MILNIVYVCLYEKKIFYIQDFTDLLLHSIQFLVYEKKKFNRYTQTLLKY